MNIDYKEKYLKYKKKYLELRGGAEAPRSSKNLIIIITHDWKKKLLIQILV